jgi:hypothetical protein
MNHGFKVSFVRMDNSGQNTKFMLQAMASDWQLDFQTKFTA